MSRIDEMIARLCPDGVEYKKLGEEGTFTRGSGIQKKDFVEDGKPCIHYGQVYTYYGLSATETKSFISDELYAGRKKAAKGDLVIATTSENEEDVCKCVAWLGDEPCAVSGDAYIFSHDQDPKYVAYLFCSDQFQEQKKRYITGTKVLRVSGDNMARIELPFPPLDVQREVVRVLDSFAELEAELEARKTQYAHYRDELLSRESLESMAGAPVDLAPLGELGTFSRGRRFTKADYVDEGIPSIHYAEVYTRFGTFTDKAFSFVRPDKEKTLRYAQPGDLVIACTGEDARDIAKAVVWLGEEPVAVHDDCSIFHHSLNPKYVSYFFQTSSFSRLKEMYSTEAKMTRISAKRLASVEIPVPPLSVQQQVVDILDRFDALTTSLIDGLPAEIEARRQQYEYYRDKLLSFPRKEVA